MTRRAFIDTNILVYAADNGEPNKRDKARTLLADTRTRFALSTQVLSEFYVTVTRTLREPMTQPEARAAVSELERLPIVATDLRLVRAAMTTCEQHQLSYWDALIIEAAIVAGCDHVLTEDLNTGATIRGIEIVNPFG